MIRNLKGKHSKALSVVLTTALMIAMLPGIAPKAAATGSQTASFYKISTVTGDPTTKTSLSSPCGVAVDSSGNFYIADSGSDCIRKVDANGTITMVAGNGTVGYSGDGGAATLAQLNYPTGVAVDSNGNLYIVDCDNNCIRKVDASGIITTVAGNGTAGYSGDGEAAAAAELNGPTGAAADASGNLYIADADNNRIRMVNASGIITTVAGTGTADYSGDGGAATSAQLHSPVGVAVDSSGNLYIADAYNHCIRKVDTNGTITTAAGNGDTGDSGDGETATSAKLNTPNDVAVDSSGNLYIADTSNNRIRKVDANGTITTVAGNGTRGFSGDGGTATSAQLFSPCGVSVDSNGNFYIVDCGNNYIRKVGTNGTITTVAGEVYCPYGVAVSASGSLYFSDLINNRIWKVDANGIITTVAGSTPGYSGDGGAAISAKLNYPTGVAVDSSGNLYIVDCNNNRIRKVDSSGIITTVAGTGTAGYSGDEGTATAAELNDPTGVAVDASGNLYIADTDNNRIRMVNASGIITTVAGTGTAGCSGDGGAATSAQLHSPVGVAVDSSGNLYIADSYNHCIRKVDTNGTITTAAEVDSATAVAVDASGYFYIADTADNRIRKVDANGIITRIAGTGTAGYSGDGGTATEAELDSPIGVAVDSSGNLFIAEYGNELVRKLTACYTVSFNTGSGSSTVDSQSVESGGYAAKPNDPTYDGYVFKGWYTDNTYNTKFNFTTAKITADTTLYAKWEEAPAPTYSISLNQSSAYTFAAQTVGYSSITPLSVTVNNTGTRATGDLTVALSGSNTGNFTLSKATVSSIAASGSDSFTVGPNTGLSAGTYTATVTVSGGNSITESFAVSFTVNSGGGSTGGGSSDGGGVGSTSYQATATVGNGTSEKLKVTTSGKSALVAVGTTESRLIANGNTLEIDMPNVPDVTSYGVEISANALSKHTGGTLTMSTALGDLSMPANMLSSLSDTTGKTAQVTISAGDTSTLSSDVQASIGDRPVIQLTLTLGGTQTEWSNPDVPVTVSIPYTPTESELKNPDSIVVWYIDGSGNAVCVPNGHYDPATGTVTFAATHFSQYAVVYRDVSFSDVSGWYENAVDYLAARGIIGGTGGGKFSPEAVLTRAQFVTILARLSGDDLSGYTASSFTDVSTDDWCFAAAQWAYGNGVAEGCDGKFSPDVSITRQDIAVMLTRYAEKVAVYTLPETNNAVTFTDSVKISSYASGAVTAMQRAGIIAGYKDGSFAPMGIATRAEAAKMIALLQQKIVK